MLQHLIMFSFTPGEAQGCQLPDTGTAHCHKGLLLFATVQCTEGERIFWAFSAGMQGFSVNTQILRWPHLSNSKMTHTASLPEHRLKTVTTDTYSYSTSIPSRPTAQRVLCFYFILFW